MRIGVIGDPHFREHLAYADYVKDRREGERQAVLDAVVAAFEDCDAVVFMGDNFNVKTNPNQVVRAFTEFVERFNGKDLFILAGNHEKTADGRTAIDYLKEVKNPKWHVITNTISVHDRLVFMPYFYKQELGQETYEAATESIMSQISAITDNGEEEYAPYDVLFTHHAISDTLVHSGQDTNIFQEIVLPKTRLEREFDLVVGGHIHHPGQYGRTIVTGSLMSNEVGDAQKIAWKITLTTSGPHVEQVRLPNRSIVKLTPQTHDMYEAIKNTLPASSIVKVVINERGHDVDGIRELLKRFDGHILLEQYPSERAKYAQENGEVLELTVGNLIKAYAKQKKLDEQVLLEAWQEVQAS